MGKRGDLCFLIVANFEAFLATNQFSLRDIATQCKIHDRCVFWVKNKLYGDEGDD